MKDIINNNGQEAEEFRAPTPEERIREYAEIAAKLGAPIHHRNGKERGQSFIIRPDNVDRFRTGHEMAPSIQEWVQFRSGSGR